MEQLYMMNERHMSNMFAIMKMEAFEYKEVMGSVRKLQNGKVANTLHRHSEMTKWASPVSKEGLYALLNRVVAQDFPTDWQDNWIDTIQMWE